MPNNRKAAKGDIRAIGIDFGTTNTAASFLDGQGVVTLIDLEKKREGFDSALLKTLLYFPSRKESFFGQDAVDQYFDRGMEGRFLQSVKRLLPNPDFQGTSIHNQYQSLEDIIARFLSEVRERIRRYLVTEQGCSETVLDEIPIIMGRPARYSLDPGREGLAVVRFRKACELAGFKNLRFLEEPVAAAHQYQQDLKLTEKVIIADLGGGTSDFTLMEFGQAKPKVLSVHGIPAAGDSLDSLIMTKRLVQFFGSEVKYQRPFSSNILTMPTSFVKLLSKWHHHAFLKERATWEFLKNLRKEIVVGNDHVFLENLMTLVEDNLGYSLHQKVEAHKCSLSVVEADTAEFREKKFDFEFRSHPIDIQFATRPEQFSEWTQETIDAIARTALDTVRYANVLPEKVDAIYFTGGTSKVSQIRRKIREAFKNARIIDKNTFTSVASGLAASQRGC